MRTSRELADDRSSRRSNRNSLMQLRPTAFHVYIQGKESIHLENINSLRYRLLNNTFITTTHIMALTKVFTALALSTLGGVASAWAPAICNAVDPAPDGLVCGQTGFASNPAGKLFSIESLSRESCTTYCGSNEACTTFEYRNTAEGSCTLFGGAFSDLRFNADDHAWDEYYEMGCFQCSSKLRPN